MTPVVVRSWTSLLDIILGLLRSPCAVSDESHSHHMVPTASRPGGELLLVADVQYLLEMAGLSDPKGRVALAVS